MEYKANDILINPNNGKSYEITKVLQQRTESNDICLFLGKLENREVMIKVTGNIDKTFDSSTNFCSEDILYTFDGFITSDGYSKVVVSQLLLGDLTRSIETSKRGHNRAIYENRIKFKKDQEQFQDEQANLIEFYNSRFLLVDILLQATKALHIIHMENNIHTDVKPRNIFVSNIDEWSGRISIVLGDLDDMINISNNNILDEDSDNDDYSSYTSSDSDHQVGTDRYRAPEVEQGIKTTKSDIYSLGITLLELLFGIDQVTNALHSLESTYHSLLILFENQKLPIHEWNYLIELFSKMIDVNYESRFSTEQIFNYLFDKIISSPSSNNNNDSNITKIFINNFKNIESAFSYVSDFIRNDVNLIQFICLLNPDTYSTLPLHLKTKKQIAINTVKRCGNLLGSIYEEFRDDEQVVLEAVKQEEVTIKGCTNYINEESLSFASERLQNDDDIVIAAIKQNPLQYRHASIRLKSDINIIGLVFQSKHKRVKEMIRELYYNIPSSILQNNTFNLINLIRNNIEEIIEEINFNELTCQELKMIINNYPNLIEYINPLLFNDDIKNDVNLNRKIIESDIRLFPYLFCNEIKSEYIIKAILNAPNVPSNYLTNELIIQALLIEQNPRARFHINIPTQFLFNINFVIEMIAVDPSLYEKCLLTNDKIVTLKAVSKDGLLLRFAFMSLLEDEQVVMEACKQNGLALRYASMELRMNREIVNIALKSDAMAILYVDYSLRTNLEYIKYIIENITMDILIYLPNEIIKLLDNDNTLLNISLELSKNIQIITWNDEVSVNCFKDKDANYWKDLSTNPNVILQILESKMFRDYEIFNYLPIQLLNDRNFMKKAITRNGLCIKYASEDIRKDFDMAMEAISENGYALLFIDESLQSNLQILEKTILSKPILICNYLKKYENIIKQDEFIEKILQSCANTKDSLPICYHLSLIFPLKDYENLERMKYLYSINPHIIASAPQPIRDYLLSNISSNIENDSIDILLFGSQSLRNDSQLFHKQTEINCLKYIGPSLRSSEEFFLSLIHNKFFHGPLLCGHYILEFDINIRENKQLIIDTIKNQRGRTSFYIYTSLYNDKDVNMECLKNNKYVHTINEITREELISLAEISHNWDYVISKNCYDKDLILRATSDKLYLEYINYQAIGCEGIKNVHPSLQQDEEIVLGFLRKNIRSLELTPMRFNCRFIKKLIKEYRLLQKSYYFLIPFRVVKQLVESEPNEYLLDFAKIILKYCKEMPLNYTNIITDNYLAFINIDGEFFKYINKENQIEIINDLLENHPNLISEIITLLPKQLISRELILQLLKTNSLPSIYWSNDLELCKICIARDPFKLFLVDNIFKHNFELTKIAVQGNGLSIIYASDDMRNNPEIAQIAIESNDFAFLFIGKELKKNTELRDLVKDKEILSYNQNSALEIFESIPNCIFCSELFYSLQ